MTQKNSQMQTLAGHYSYARLFRKKAEHLS